MNERGRGRPPVGPRIAIRVDAELLARIDADAERYGITRAERIRLALAQTFG